MGFNCTVARCCVEDLIASDTVFVAPGGGFRPRSAASDALQPHKCWSITENKEEHRCWIDGSCHKLSEVPEMPGENERQNDDRNKERQGFNQPTYHNSGPAHTTNVRSPAVAGVRVNNKDMKIPTLFQKGVLRVGDLWKFSFVFQTANGEHLVQKEGTVTGLSKSGGRPGFPDLRFPPAQYISSDPARQDLTIKACTGPDGFCKAVLQVYGPIQSGTSFHGKSWRSVHVTRNGQDLGTLADIREAFDPGRNYW